MSHPGKSLFERLRVSLTWFYILGIIVLVLFGESFYQSKFLGRILFTLGGCLAAIGACGRIWCSLYISGYKNNTLICEGPYSLCRHPLYFFSFIGALGIGLSTGNFSIPAIISVGIAFFYPVVISYEEARLAVIHGENFETYRKNTPAFFPRFGAFREPEEYMVRPKIFRKDIGDVIWFILIVFILQLFAALRIHEYIPTLLILY